MIWKSILGLLSTRQVFHERDIDRTRTDILLDDDQNRIDSDEMAEIIAFSYDAALCLLSLYHMVIIVKAGLWCVDGEGIREIPNARIELENLVGDTYYVDIVSESGVSDYARSSVRHFETLCRKLLKNVVRRRNRLGWKCSQRQEELAKILAQVTG